MITDEFETDLREALARCAADVPAHVGEVKLTGHSTFSEGQLQDIAKMHPGDRVAAARISQCSQAWASSR